MWRATTQQPLIMKKNQRIIEGSRWGRRPSALVKSAGKRYATEKLIADEYDGCRDDFSSEDRMPDEYMQDDVGWNPGPIVKPRPPFRGPKPGPADPNITAHSSARTIMAGLLTKEFKYLVCKHTYTHILAWRAQRDKAGMQWGSIETAFDKGDLSWLGWDPDNDGYDQSRFENVFDMWIVAKLKVAQLKPEIPAKALWGHFKAAPALYDAELDRLMTFAQFQFLCRHMSFAHTPDVEDDDVGGTAGCSGEPNDREDDASESGGSCGDAEEDEDTGDGDGGSGAKDPADDGGGGSGAEDPADRAYVDTHRKRRELTDQACRDFSKFWNPHQFCGMDEGSRATKHWDKIRIRFKASIHSGSLVDMLNDCRTYFCMWFEEQNWHSKRQEGEEVNSVLNRISRAIQVLIDKGKDANGVSTSNYCLSLDRGYGHMAAQKHAAAKGVHTNAMMADNRVGLPREYIAQARKDLACEGGCNHSPENDACRKHMWTVLNKDGFELCLWQDSKTIVSYGNFFSASRCGELARGSHGAKDSYHVWVPESIWHYNIEGRSATDAGDQLRRKLAMAERRITRAGHKGISFVFDIAFSNGAVTWRFLQPSTTPRRVLDQEYTKVPPCRRPSYFIAHHATTTPLTESAHTFCR